MNDKITPPLNAEQPTAPAEASGLSRRRLVRAGLTAAPVLAALQSNTVLAGGGDHSCIRPSSFSSLKLARMTVSRGRVIRDDFECKSHGYWKNNRGNLTRNYKDTKFISADTGFTTNPGHAYSDKSLQQVLEMRGNDNNTALARHVVAAFLSAKSVGNDSDRVLLSVSQCQAIWNGQGNWAPFAGANWTLKDTMNYFNKVFGSAFL
ncbi:hypothetical protein [Hydrogenophaga sp.]|uniref:hypothetical protein n=1 Tax=Hydrogenophaga sp. TaxID=1904254 RepID=UPI00272F47F7|nr:hypothetical protein [Hydrogenophaga sp.]MDP1684495.1 hypothetical protein [Hydrogenophaga sp.]